MQPKPFHLLFMVEMETGGIAVQRIMTKPQMVLPTGASTVAVIDDDQAVCNSLKFSLELEGFKVRTYSNGPELLRAGEFGSVDCFVVDQRMPGISGLDLIAKLREQRIAAPAILIVSQPSATLSVRAAEASVQFVEKPFLGNTLVEAIHKACQGG
jgi:two-component system, LuxR family, response regulator FixJ